MSNTQITQQMIQPITQASFFGATFINVIAIPAFHRVAKELECEFRLGGYNVESPCNIIGVVLKDDVEKFSVDFQIFNGNVFPQLTYHYNSENDKCKRSATYPMQVGFLFDFSALCNFFHYRFLDAFNEINKGKIDLRV